MGYLYKKIKTDNKIVFEFKVKNFCIFVAIVLLSLIPAIYIVEAYVENINVFRIFYVLLVLTAYAVLDGRAIITILFSKNVIRQGSVFSTKNPLKFIINNK